MQKKTILITGGAGFIGSHVNARFQQAGYDTLIFDSMLRGNARAVTAGEVVEGDITDPKDVETLFDDHHINGVVHLAGLIQVGESLAHPDRYYHVNVTGSLNLMRAMHFHSVNPIVFSSSAAIFGKPRTELIDESHPFNPINPYGRSKLMVERMLLDLDHAYGLTSCSLRYFNAAGADLSVGTWSRDETNLIPIVLQSLLQPDGKVKIFGTNYDTPDGTCVRDYVHVSDLADAHLLAFEKLLEGSPTCRYNLGTGRGYSVREVIAAVERVTGRKVHAIDGERRTGDPARLVACAERARGELTWKPQHPQIETIIQHAWEAMNAQQRLPSSRP